LVTAILTADIHLWDNPPSTRIDDFLVAQERKLKFLKELQAKYKCPVIDAGDVFNGWKASPWVTLLAYHLLPTPFITVPGNHDLPEHSMKLYEKSSLALLEKVRKGVAVLSSGGEACLQGYTVAGFAYGEKLGRVDGDIVIIHDLVYPTGKPPWPGAEGYEARKLFELFPHAKLILTGHNHTAFVEEHEGRLLVNPGSMMRLSIDKADYKPRCYLYYGKQNRVRAVYYPIEQGVFDLTHRAAMEERKKRMEAYIERMNMGVGWGVQFSFRANLEQFFKENKIPRLVREVIWKHLES